MVITGEEEALLLLLSLGEASINDGDDLLRGKGGGVLDLQPPWGCEEGLLLLYPAGRNRGAGETRGGLTLRGRSTSSPPPNTSITGSCISCSIFKCVCFGVCCLFSQTQAKSQDKVNNNERERERETRSGQQIDECQVVYQNFWLGKLFRRMYVMHYSNTNRKTKLSCPGYESDDFKYATSESCKQQK